jgi:hypothetical protein
MKKLLFFILLLSVAFSKTVAIEEFELENKSEIYSFTGNIYLTCENRTVDIFLYDGKPIDNATVFLMYEYGVLSNGVTDENGEAHLWFTGNYQFMTKLFQIRIDKPTYKKMLINFNVDECKRGERGFYIMHDVETFIPSPPEPEENKSKEAPEENRTNKIEEVEKKQPEIKIEKPVEEKPEEKPEPCAPVGIFTLAFAFLVGRREWL